MKTNRVAYVTLIALASLTGAWADAPPTPPSNGDASTQQAYAAGTGASTGNYNQDTSCVNFDAKDSSGNDASTAQKDCIRNQALRNQRLRTHRSH